MNDTWSSPVCLGGPVVTFVFLSGSKHCRIDFGREAKVLSVRVTSVGEEPVRRVPTPPTLTLDLPLSQPFFPRVSNRGSSPT